MATITYIKETKQTASAMKGLIDYCCQEEKTFDRNSGEFLIGGVNVNGFNAFKEFMATKNSYHKTDGINFYQYVQSFSPEVNICAKDAHEIALEFAQKAWQGHEVLVTTHTDANHLHSHFVINSVSFENGYKLRQSPNTLVELRALSDEICQTHRLSTLKPYEEGGLKISTREYRVAQKGESWKFKLMSVIDESMKKSGSREDFIKTMESYGYGVNWTDSRKYITFTCPSGMKCRDIKLHDEKYLKENIGNELQFRSEYYTRRKHNLKQTDARTAQRKEFSEYTNLERTAYAGDGSYTREELGYDGGSSEIVSGVPHTGVRTTEYSAYESTDERLYGRVVENSVEGVCEEQCGTGSESGKYSGSGGGYSKEDERVRRTGWEENRSSYERYLGQGRTVTTSDSQSSVGETEQKRMVETSIDIGNSFDISGGVIDSAVRMVASLGDESEDPEERRKRMEAQENASNLGALIGLAVGLLTPEDEEIYEEQEDFEMKMDM